MGKLLSIIVGAIAVLAGSVLLLSWRYEVILILKGIVPGILLLGGVISVIAGVSEFRDTARLAEKEGE